MLGPHLFLSAQLAAERSSRLAAETTAARWRRLARRPHPAPACGALAAQLGPLVVDLSEAPAAEVPTSTG